MPCAGPSGLKASRPSRPGAERSSPPSTARSTTSSAVAIDFGALAAERASATRMLMTIAQIIKHLDSARPVRFLVAETETGYTLLSALWLARRLGIADRVEISPLFETEEAIGARSARHRRGVAEPALAQLSHAAMAASASSSAIPIPAAISGRSRRPSGSSGCASVSLNCWLHYDLTDVELVIFDTHGESFGRGAHPASLTDRLAYLDAAVVAARLRPRGHRRRAGIKLSGQRRLSACSAAFRLPERPSRASPSPFSVKPRTAWSIPIYEEPDFATEFFGTVRQEMADLVDDPGYAALIGTFGPSLLDTTGSRPTARQIEGAAPARIRHPRELRAIPNNAILQQLGWLANSIHGLGHAASRAPDLFRHMRQRSGRFERAYRLAEHAMAMSDLDVIRAYVDTLDPGSWFDRARRTKREGRRDELLAVAGALERLDLAPALRRLFRRFATDSLKLKTVAGDVPRMSTRLASLHVLRLTVIHRIWLTATHIPDFRPQNGLSRELLLERILRLDIPASLALLSQIFPSAPDPTADLDFGEPPGPREGDTYEALHRDIFEPMRRTFDLVREISGAIQHEIGAFG